MTKNGRILKISTDFGFLYIKTTQKKYQGDLKDFYISSVY